MHIIYKNYIKGKRSMTEKEFINIGGPLPKIKAKEHLDFILNMQNAMLDSLVERKLLTASQKKQVGEVLMGRLKRK